MKPFTIIAILIFIIVAAVQVTRIALGWPVLINGVSIPIWASVIAAAVAALMAAMLWRENRRPA